MDILGIETSCDETSVAVVRNGIKIMINLVSSQEKIHQKYYGVVPELASRAHLENINWLLAQTFSQLKTIDAVAVTTGPGLIGSLFVGVMTAKTVAYLKRVPLIGINHLEGHIYANFLTTDADSGQRIADRKQGNKNNIGSSSLTARHSPLTAYLPCIALIVSGGHTDLVYMEKIGKYKVLGRTRDDAVGECYDKIAKLLRLGYPGGPIIDRLAQKGDPQAVRFPRPFMWDSWDFSFSGLKTAVVNYVSGQRIADREQRDKCKVQDLQTVADLCASFQQSVVDVLVEKTFKAAKKYRIKNILLGGGVSANKSLRKTFTEYGKNAGINVRYPSLELCTDNAAMIASAAYFRFKKSLGKYSWQKSIIIDPELKLKNWR